MSFTKIWIHAVFSTKHRLPHLTKEIRSKVWDHIRSYCYSKKIILENINGSTDHAHCLIKLGKTQTISEVMNLIKGESSYWINQNRVTKSSFQWQTDYWAASVSESDFERVNNYINNQELHHADKDFEVELQQLIKEFGLDKFE